MIKSHMRTDNIEKNTKTEMVALADSSERKPRLVLYHALNRVLKDSIRLFEISSLKREETFGRHFVGTVAVANDSIRVSHRRYVAE